MDVHNIRTRGGVLLGVLVSGALAAGTLGGAPTANATCASFFGIGNSADCTSSLTSIAIAIGSGATASATGLFGTAFAVGPGAKALTFAGAFNTAVAIGDQSSANADYLFTFAAALGGQKAYAGAGGPGGLGDVAINVGSSQSNAIANGLGNLSLDIFGTPAGAAFTYGAGNVSLNVGGYYAGAEGYFNNATNLLSPGTQVMAFVSPSTPATLSSAFSILGSNNIVAAGRGPLAVAGSIGQTGQSITKMDPGFNINGVVVGGAAAVGSKRTSLPAASTSRYAGPSAAAPARSTSARPASAAASRR